ncbi:MAG: ParA family protein [Oscillospiraceae bacterium]|jgi:Mrp family chromosome partitioning ATPase|nr:ParA family protein [Oscillospiraceae bacterium]
MPEILRSPLIIICGHYGAGKTNLALNIAIDRSKAGKNVTVVDLDIVNPYFRTSDYERILSLYGIRLISSRLNGSTLDAPGLSPEILRIFDAEPNPDDFTIIDAGGDPEGARVLGRYADRLSAKGYEMLYVVNKYRPETATARLASALLPEIEAASRLKATGVIANSHLCEETKRESIVAGMRYARETAMRLEIPLVMVVAKRELCPELSMKNLFPVDIFVHAPW